MRSPSSSGGWTREPTTSEPRPGEPEERRDCAGSPAPGDSPGPSTATSGWAAGTPTKGSTSPTPGRAGTSNLPAVYADRIFRAFRSFGSPNRGFGVTADPSSLGRRG